MNLFNIFFKKSSKNFVSDITKTNIYNAWENVEFALNSKTPSQLRQALITADKCLDNALRDMVKGESLGQRLKNGQHFFDDVTYQNIWRAHKIRNNLVHEAGYEPSYVSLINSINDLKKGIIKLGVDIK